MRLRLNTYFSKFSTHYYKEITFTKYSDLIKRNITHGYYIVYSKSNEIVSRGYFENNGRLGKWGFKHSNNEYYL